MNIFQFFESRSKHSTHNPDTVILLTMLPDSTKPIVEVTHKGTVVCSMQFPPSSSGVTFAKRVYNGLQ